MKKILQLSILCAVAGSYAQTSTQNYVKETTRRTASTSGTSMSNTHFTTTTYYDRLGRPVQVVDQNSSPEDNKNIVTHIEYEKNIGQVKQYLSFTSPGYTSIPVVGGSIVSYHSNFVDNAQSQTLQFYQTYNDNYTTVPYSEIRKEASPRQRVLETGSPGEVWAIGASASYTPPEEDQRSSIRSAYSLNEAGEVKRYTVTTGFADGIYKNSISENGFHPEGILTKTVVKNENWKGGDGTNNTVEEFKDVKGNVVLKRNYNNAVAHDTYYVYNKRDQLSFVIPPMAGGSAAAADLDKWGYRYNYDTKGRLAEKKLPQKDWEYLIYDKADRVVMSGPVYSPFGDGTKGWLMTKYDNFGRVAYTGYYAGSTFTSAVRNTLAQNNFSVETRITTNTTIDGIAVGYTNTGFPTSFKLLTVSYYDNYEFPNAPAAVTTVEGQAVNTNLKGQFTAGWTRTLTTAASTAGTLSYRLYDDKYRVIRSYSQNHLGGYTQADSKLSFTGVPTKTVTHQKQNASAAVLTITDNFTYDLRDRLVQHTQQIGNAVVENIATNAYDVLGVLTDKKIGGLSTGTGLQKVDYKYNVRGWLTDINNAELYVEDTENDLFQMKFNYEERGGSFGNRLYNGNINSVYTRTKSDNVFRGYSYYYDGLNRLTNAKGLYYENGGWNMGVRESDGFNESLTYDKNGNILTLNRTGMLLEGQKNTIDDLTYTYNANQLLSVTDATNSTQGFNDANKIGNDYTYDTFGNITTDKNKGITAVSYNHQNLPYKVTFSNGGTISYTYNASGTRLAKKVQPSGGTAVITDYTNGFQYENNVLQFFSHHEGYVKRNTDNTYLYAYQYKDHLGNIRLSYADVNKNGTIEPATEILEENNYYPFGLKHKGYNEIANINRNEAAEKYNFLGQEFEADLGFNVTATDFRKYDSTVGRFFSMDALSETSVSMNPYHYGYNSPIFWSDPSGLLSQSLINSIWDSSGSGITIWRNEGDYFRSSRKLDTFGNAYNVYNDGTVEESLDQLVITAPRWAFNGGSFNAYALGNFSLDKQIQNHVYTTANLYQGYRDGIWSKKWDDFQDGLDWFGSIPGAGEPIDLINAAISAVRGNYIEAGVSVGAMIPVGGYVANAVKIQKHHIIPKAIYRDAGDAIKNAMNLNAGNNLKKLPAGFHGNHPQYSKFVASQLDAIRNTGVTPGSIQSLQKNLNSMINQAYDNYKATGQNLNEYFRQFN